jgi:hypothetical protein
MNRGRTGEDQLQGENAILMKSSTAAGDGELPGWTLDDKKVAGMKRRE